jgi:hypothetical protein
LTNFDELFLQPFKAQADTANISVVMMSFDELK